MIALRRKQVELPQVMWLVAGLAWLTAVIYLFIESGLVGVGDLAPEEGSSAIVFAAAACYALGGLLILLRRRWLWLIGAVINGLVIWFFLSMYAERPLVLLSPGGVSSKVAQILLEAALIYLIIADWRRGR